LTAQAARPESGGVRCIKWGNRAPGVSLLAAVLLLLSHPLRAQRERLPPDDLDYVEKKWPNAKKTGTDIRYIIERAGHGATAQPGDVVYVHYVGTLLDGTLFDKNVGKAKPFSFRVGRGLVIEGWDQVLQLMRPGEKRLVIIPSELAYGSVGEPPKIPRDATLVFEIELLSVDREQ
jgi:FKBP-type peptidyl-prolyl cis-trans isomerase